MWGPWVPYVRRRGVGGGLTCFVLRGQKIGCHSVIGLAQPPSDHAGGGEGTSWKLDDCVFLTNYLICFTLCGFYPKDICRIPKKWKKIKISITCNPDIKLLTNSFQKSQCYLEGARLSPVLALVDETSEKAGESTWKVPRLSSALSLTWQGT